MLLCYCGFKLQNNLKHEPVQPFFDPEWQAKCFAGEFMISHKLTKNMSSHEIAIQCGVSLAAANYQYTHRISDLYDSFFILPIVYFSYASGFNGP